jgi:hypothetical protein
MGGGYTLVYNTEHAIEQKWYRFSILKAGKVLMYWYSTNEIGY